MGTMTASRARRLYLANPDQQTDQLSIQIQQRIQHHWKTVIRHLAPAGRMEWLRHNTEAIAGLGARRCRELLRDLEFRQLRISRDATSEPWMSDRWHEDAEAPSGMPMSHCSTQMGIPGVLDGHLALASKRPTPMPAISVEDQMDSLSARGADYYVHPPSVSAVVISEIRHLKATESKGRRARGQREHVPAVTPNYGDQCQRLDLRRHLQDAPK